MVGLAKAWTDAERFAKAIGPVRQLGRRGEGPLGLEATGSANRPFPWPTSPALNLDMVGRLRDNHLIVYGSRSGYGWRRLLSLQNGDAGLDLDFTWTLEARADHYSFFAAGHARC